MSHEFLGQYSVTMVANNTLHLLVNVELIPINVCLLSCFLLYGCGVGGRFHKFAIKVAIIMAINTVQGFNFTNLVHWGNLSTSTLTLCILTVSETLLSEPNRGIVDPTDSLLAGLNDPNEHLKSNKGFVLLLLFYQKMSFLCVKIYYMLAK